MRRFVIGDIHGGYRALAQVLGRSPFDPSTDRLICIGDVCDGWPETKECIDELLKMDDLVYILGNHDEWALEWMKHGLRPSLWVEQGGRETRQSYGWPDDVHIPDSHVRFLENAKLWHEEDNKLFVHGGYQPGVPLVRQSKDTFLWSRDLWTGYGHEAVTDYEEVYIGHTQMLDADRPENLGRVWNVDTGGGWTGVLSIMDIDTKEAWTSDPVPELYPEVKGRGG